VSPLKPPKAGDGIVRLSGPARRLVYDLNPPMSGEFIKFSDGDAPGSFGDNMLRSPLPDNGPMSGEPLGMPLESIFCSS